MPKIIIMSFRKYTLKLDTEEIVLDVDPEIVLNTKKADGRPVVNADIQKDLNDLIANDEGIHLRELVIGLDMLMPGIERDIMREIHSDVNPRIVRLIEPIDGIGTDLSSYKTMKKISRLQEVLLDRSISFSRRWKSMERV